MTGISNLRTADWVAGIALIAVTAVVSGYAGGLDRSMESKPTTSATSDGNNSHVTASPWFHEKAWSLD